MWIVDTKKEHLAVDEAQKLGIPIVAILDTNCDPDEVAFPIPGNDDAIRSVSLLTRVIADAVAEGLIERNNGKSGGNATDEPMAEWERELLEQHEAGKAEGTEKTESAEKAESAEQTESAEKVEEAPAEAPKEETPAAE